MTNKIFALTANKENLQALVFEELDDSQASAVWGGARGPRGRTPSYIRRAIEEQGKTLEDFLDDEGNFISPLVS